MERERLAKLEIAKERRLRAKQKKEERLSLSPSKKMESQKLEEQNQKLLTKSVLKSYQKKKKRAKAMILEDSSDEMSISGKSSSVRVARLLRSLHRNNTDVESAICGVCKYAAGLDVGQEAEAARTLSAIIPFCTIERYVIGAHVNSWITWRRRDPGGTPRFMQKSCEGCFHNCCCGYCREYPEAEFVFRRLVYSMLSATDNFLCQISIGRCPKVCHILLPCSSD